MRGSVCVTGDDDSDGSESLGASAYCPSVPRRGTVQGATLDAIFALVHVPGCV